MHDLEPATRAANAAAVCASCGQPLRSEERSKRKKFMLGMVLAWVPFVPFIIGLLNAFRGMSKQNATATGVGVTATGVGVIYSTLAEVAVTCFLLLAPICIVAAFLLLLRSLSRVHPLRTFLAVVSLGWTALVAVATVLVVLALVFLRHRVSLLPS